MYRNAKAAFLSVALFLCNSFISFSQCAMCRAAIETEGNTTKAEALNDGIVYLMARPYVLVGILGYIIYRMRKKKQV
jgi:hypothetical protein